MGIKILEPPRRPDRVAIVHWSIAFVVLGLLMLTLLSLPFQLYAVRTGSMEPAFGSRDLVVVHLGEWQQGQPISFTHHGEVITHRLVSVNADGTFVTKGDANKTADPWVVQPGEARGAVVASVPQLGYWLVYLKTIAGLASVLFAAAGMWLLWPLARELDFKRSDDAGDGADDDNSADPTVDPDHTAEADELGDTNQPVTEPAKIGALSGV